MPIFARSSQLPAGDQIETDEAKAPGEERPDPPQRRHPRVRQVVSIVLTVLGAALVMFALIGPNRLSDMHPMAFVRIPVEGIVAAVLIIVLPPRLRTVFVVLTGVGLGLLTILKLFDFGFYLYLNRTFDPIADAPLLGDAADYVHRTHGKLAEDGAVVGAVLIGVAALVLMTLAVWRLARLAVRHRTAVTRTSVVLTAAWVACTLLAVQLTPHVRVASRSASGLLAYRARDTVAGILDSKNFLAQIASDPFRNTPNDQLLSALHGKDVLIIFVESYGAFALKDPGVNEVLDQGSAKLTAAGYTARTAWVTSPTYGGGSWLAHSTLQTGLWIDNQRRYTRLLTSARMSLSTAFKRAGWHTVGVVPANNASWPEGKFYHYDKLYAAHDMGYQGPLFNFGSVPDQYTLSAFQRNERAPGHQPVMAELDLLSSHSPWTPLPHFTDWNAMGDGSVFRTMPADRIKDLTGAYLQGIRYSLTTVLSYLATYGDPNLAVVFLGDHQATTLITGQNATHNTPVTILSEDHALMDRVSGWGWQDGIKPGSAAPVWKMNLFRDKFLSAFSSTSPTSEPAPSPSPARR